MLKTISNLLLSILLAAPVSAQVRQVDTRAALQPALFLKGAYEYEFGVKLDCKHVVVKRTSSAVDAERLLRRRPEVKHWRFLYTQRSLGSWVLIYMKPVGSSDVAFGSIGKDGDYALLMYHSNKPMK